MSADSQNMTKRDGVTLKEYMDTRFKAMQEEINTKIRSIEKATTLAAHTLEKRLEHMNEFRDALKNQAHQFVTRAELQNMRELIEADIRMLREAKAALEGKASQLYVTVTMLVSILGLFLAVLSYFIE